MISLRQSLRVRQPLLGFEFPVVLRRLELIIFIFFAVGLALPIWLSDLPPMTDVPQHAAQVSLLLEILSGSAHWGQYEIRWFTPYLFAYLITAALAIGVGVPAACKIVISIALVALPLSVRYLIVRTKGVPQASWLAVFGSFGFTYQWGFVSFMLAIVLMVFALTILWSYVDGLGLTEGVKLAGMVVCLFFCHALVFGFFIALAGAMILTRWRGWRGVVWSMVPLCVGIPLALAWLLYSKSHASMAYPMDWDLSWFETSEPYYNKASWIEFGDLGFGRFFGFFARILGFRDPLVAMGFGFFLVAWPFLMGWKFRIRDVRVSLPFALVLTVLFLAPSFVFGTAFVFQRFSLLFFPFYALLFVGTGRHSFRGAIPLFVLFLVGWSLWFAMAHHEFRQGVRDFRSVSSFATERGDAISLVFDRDDGFSIAPVWLHFPVWQMSVSGWDVSPNLSATHIQLVTYKPGREPAESVNKRFEWVPRSIARDPISCGCYDYVFVRSLVDPGDYVTRGFPKGVNLLRSEGVWWLYKAVR